VRGCTPYLLPPSSYLLSPEVSLALLPQRYTRRSADTYWYESPTTSYEALLEIDESGSRVITRGCG
jgi:hypothetical protein